MPRLFVGIEIPQAVATTLEALKTDMPGVRWSDPRNYHITLSFIGEVAELTVRQITFALPYVDQLPFIQKIKGLGLFEEANHPRVLWAGADSTPPLNHLKGEVDKALRLAGIDVGYKRYIPHVTLARLQDVQRDALDRFMETHHGLAAGPFEVNEFVLYESHQGPNGYHYEPLGRYALTRREP